MALDDLAAGRGVVPFIDPKDGQAADELLSRIPRELWDRVVLVDPSRLDYAVGLNPLECPSAERRDIVIDSVIQVFADLFHDVWGGRQAVIMQRSLITLLHNPGATLCDLVPLLTDARARLRLTARLRASKGDPIARPDRKTALFEDGPIAAPRADAHGLEQCHGHR